MHSIYFVPGSRAELSLLSELAKLPSRAKLGSLMHRASPSLARLGSFPALIIRFPFPFSITEVNGFSK